MADERILWEGEKPAADAGPLPRGGANRPPTFENVNRPGFGAASGGATGPAGAIVAAMGRVLALVATMALGLWGGYGVAIHLSDPANWPLDAARTQARAEAALARLAPSPILSLAQRRELWSAEIAAALEQSAADGAGSAAADLPLAEAWLSSAPVMLGENAMAAFSALRLGHAPPFPADFSRRDAAMLAEQTRDALARQEEAAAGRVARVELALLPPRLAADFAALGGEARARGFVPGTATGRDDALRLPRGSGLSREILLYGDFAELARQACAVVRVQAGGMALQGAAPAACAHPQMPQTALDRGAYAFAALGAALAGPQNDDEPAAAFRARGADILQGVRRRGGLSEALDRALRDQALLAVETTMLTSGVLQALSAADAGPPGALADALGAAARAALARPDAAPLGAMLEAVGAAADGASPDTARRLVDSAERTGPLMANMKAAAALGPPALAVRETRRGDLAGLAPRTPVVSWRFARDVAVALGGLVLAGFAVSALLTAALAAPPRRSQLRA